MRERERDSHTATETENEIRSKCIERYLKRKYDKISFQKISYQIFFSLFKEKEKKEPKNIFTRYVHFMFHISRGILVHINIYTDINISFFITYYYTIIYKRVYTTSASYRTRSSSRYNKTERNENVTSRVLKLKREEKRKERETNVEVMVHGWKKAPPWNGTELQTKEGAQREGVALEENESRFGCQSCRCDDARSEVTRSGLVPDDRRPTRNFDISGRERRCESPAMDIIRIFREAYPDVDLRHVSALSSSSSSSSGTVASADTGQRNEESDASGRDPSTQQSLISWSYPR